MIIFKVPDAFSTSEPSSLASFELLHRIYARHETIVEKRICFPEIYNIDGKSFVFWRVDYPEVEPLGVSFGVQVVLQE